MARDSAQNDHRMIENGRFLIGAARLLFGVKTYTNRYSFFLLSNLTTLATGGSGSRCGIARFSSKREACSSLRWRSRSVAFSSRRSPFSFHSLRFSVASSRRSSSKISSFASSLAHRAHVLSNRRSSGSPFGRSSWLGAGNIQPKNNQSVEILNFCASLGTQETGSFPVFLAFDTACDVTPSSFDNSESFFKFNTDSIRSRISIALVARSID